MLMECFGLENYHTIFSVVTLSHLDKSFINKPLLYYKWKKFKEPQGKHLFCRTMSFNWYVITILLDTERNGTFLFVGKKSFAKLYIFLKLDIFMLYT